MAAKKSRFRRWIDKLRRQRKKRKKPEVSKLLALWAVVVATISAAASYVLAGLCLDPVSDLTSTIFTACIGYLITYAGKSLGEKISRNRHGLDADGNPLPDTSVPVETTQNTEEDAKG